MLLAGQIRKIKQMPVAVRQVLDESSQQMRCLHNMSANDIVETFRMCERAKLWLKQRKYKLVLRMWKTFASQMIKLGASWQEGSILKQMPQTISLKHTKILLRRKIEEHPAIPWWW